MRLSEGNAGNIFDVAAVLVQSASVIDVDAVMQLGCVIRGIERRSVVAVEDCACRIWRRLVIVSVVVDVVFSALLLSLAA